MSNTAPEKISASAVPQKSEKLGNLATSGALELPAIKELLKNEALAIRIRSILDKISATYASQSNEQAMKFLADLKEAVEIDDSLVPDILTACENDIIKYTSTITAEQKTQIAEQKTQVAQVEKVAEEQKVQVAEQKTQTGEQKTQIAKAGEDKQAIESREYASKGFDTVILGLSVAKKRIQELTGKSPESIIGESVYQKELAKNNAELSEKYGSLEGLPPVEQAKVREQIHAKAESLVIFTHQSKIIESCPAEHRAELTNAIGELAKASGFEGNLRDGTRTDPKISASEYQLAKTIAGDRRDIYQDGRITRAVADEKGTYPSFIPGQGLYMNADHLKIRIQLAPEDELRVNDLQSAEIKDKIQLDALKNEDITQKAKLQNYELTAWRKIQKEWSLATRWVQEILLQKWINFMNPEWSRDTLTKENIAALRNDPKLQAEIQKGADDGSEFAPEEFFNGLDLLAISFKQSDDESQLKRTSAINQLQTKLNSKNPESYGNLTKSIYEQAYATARKNLLVLTEDFGLDGAGQQFVDHFLAILNEHRAGAAKLNLSKELTADKKKDIALALNALIKKNPPLFSVQNGEIDTQISPVERKRAILRGLREQKFLLPPDDRVSETSIRNALGAR